MDYPHRDRAFDTNPQSVPYPSQFVSQPDFHSSAVHPPEFANSIGYHANLNDSNYVDPHTIHNQMMFSSSPISNPKYSSPTTNSNPPSHEYNSITTVQTADVEQSVDQSSADVMPEQISTENVNTSNYQQQRNKNQPKDGVESVTSRRSRRNRNSAPKNKETTNTDAHVQWYQAMIQYYSQIYPGYNSSMAATAPAPPNSARYEPSSQSNSLRRSTKQPNRRGIHTARTISIPTNKPAIQPNASAATAASDYAAAYYRYYFYHQQQLQGGAFPPQMDPFWMQQQHHLMSVGAIKPARLTPHCHASPHIRAFLGNPGLLVQVLPHRPADGELARIELIDLTELANQSLGQATSLINASSTTSESRRRQGHQGSSHYSLADSTDNDQSDSVLYEEDDEHHQQVQACTAIALAWDRADHAVYPGPLLLGNKYSTTNRGGGSGGGVMKADVLAYLKDKLVELQDRMPIDWESAGLLVSYLEALVKNNGQIQPDDLVNLLLESYHDEPEQFSASASSDRRQQLSSARPDLSLSSLAIDDSDNEVRPSSRRRNLMTSSSRPASDAYDVKQALLLRRTAASLTHQQPASGQGQQDKVTNRYRNLLLHGMPMKALEHACRNHLWGHAFLLAQRLGPAMLDKVMGRFLTNAVSPSDPMLTLYQFTANQLPQSIQSAAYVQDSGNDDWRPHLAMLISAASFEWPSNPGANFKSTVEQLGDCLLSRRQLYAAHFCYLLMGPLMASAGVGGYKLPDKICLLGRDASSRPSASPWSKLASSSLDDATSLLQVASEAIQLTEVYEYAMRLGVKDYHLVELLPFKLAYAYRLFDAGLLEKTYHYLASIGHSLLTAIASCCRRDDDTTCLVSLAEHCLRLAEPLHYRQLEGFELGGAGHSDSWLVELRRWLENTAAGFYSINKLPGDLPSSSTHQHSDQRSRQASASSRQHQGNYHHGGDRVDADKPVNFATGHHQPLTESHQYGDGDFKSRQLGPTHDINQRPRQSLGDEPIVTSHHHHESVGHHSRAHPTTTTNQHQSSNWQPQSATQQQFRFKPEEGVNKQEAAVSMLPPNAPTPVISTAVNRDPLDLRGQQQSQPSPPTNMDLGPSSPNHHAISTAGNTQSSFAPIKSEAVRPPPMSHPQAPPSSSFFTPLPVPNGPSMQIGEDGQQHSPTTSVQPAYDYFSAMQSMTGGGGPPKSESRSRVNSTSSHDNTPTSSYYPQHDRAPPPSTNAVKPLPEQGSRSSWHQQPQSSDHRQQASSNATDRQHGRSSSPQTIGDSNQGPQSDADSQQQSANKSGWVASLFSRFRGNASNQVHLPDDSNRSIVWDEERKRWIDTSDPNADEPDCPPPPPMIPMTSAATMAKPLGTPSFPSRTGSTTLGSRYVNTIPTLPPTSGVSGHPPHQLQPPPIPPPTSFGANLQQTRHHQGP